MPPRSQSPRQRVLIVEDDHSLAHALEATLQQEAFDVLKAPDGEAAVKMVLEGRPQLILLDIGLPGASGIDVLRALRLRGVTIPVIVMTSSGQKTDQVRATEAGATAFFVKTDVSLDGVARLVQQFLA